MTATMTQVPQQPKTRKGRLKNIRLSFAPSNNYQNVSHKNNALNNNRGNRNLEFWRKIFVFNFQQPKENSAAPPTPVVESIVVTPAAADVQPFQRNNEPKAQTHHQHTKDWLLQPSPSETSLQRSRSLTLPPRTKHSPDCKDNPYAQWNFCWTQRRPEITKWWREREREDTKNLSYIFYNKYKNSTWCLTAVNIQHSLSLLLVFIIYQYIFCTSPFILL